MNDPSSLIFGKYEPIRRLALGGMGEVFLARQTGGVSGTERLVILKSLLSELAEQEGFVDQFLDEARVAAKLNHPNIVQMFEAGLWNGMYFIAMEYIRGENLSRLQKIAREREMVLPVHIVVRIVRDALLGLAHAHTAVDDMTGKPLHVVHRDVSPHNIMVRIDGVTKLVDFGIAKAANKLDRTKTGVLKGKLQFMSPEQVLGDDVDARTDQFAMGVVLWELLTCRRLFQGDNEIQVLRAVTQQTIASPSSIVPGLAPDLEAVVMRMLERDRHKRYPDCGVAADELTAWLNQGSRRVSEGDVSVFVKQIVGDSIDEVTRSSVSGENFLLKLQLTPSHQRSRSSEGAPDTSRTVVRQQGENRRRGAAAIGLGAAAAVALAVAVYAVVGGAQTAEVAARPANPPTPPTTPTTPTTPAPLTIPPANATRRADGAVEVVLADPPNAQVIVDGAERPERTPTVVVLDNGPHTIELRAPDGRQGRVALAFAKPVVVVVSDPPGASIGAGGVSFGIAPARLDGKLESGVTHRLTLAMRGYVTREVVVEDLKDGEVRELKVALEKAVTPKATSSTAPVVPPPSAPPSAPPATKGLARLTVNIQPAAKVYVDGDLVGTTPLVLPKIEAGTHRLTLERTDGSTKKTVTVTLKEGEDKKLPLAWD